MSPRPICRPTHNPAGPRSRSTAGPRARSHDVIVAATRRLLIERGYRRLNFDTLAAQVGVAKTTIYRRWPSKADLVLDVLEREFTRDDLPAATLPRLDAIFDPASFPDLARVIAALAVDTDDDNARRTRLHEIVIGPGPGTAPSIAGRDDTNVDGGLDGARVFEWYCGNKLFHALIGVPVAVRNPSAGAPTE